jgi:hypothetical protein
MKRRFEGKYDELDALDRWEAESEIYFAPVEIGKRDAFWSKLIIVVVGAAIAAKLITG